MKKMLKKIFGGISAFIIGAQTKIFAIEQTEVYGPPIDPNRTVKSIEEAKSFSAITGAQILSMVVSILLFIIGVIVIFNKKISKKVKIIVSSIIAIVIVSLVMFCLYYN